MSPLLMTNALDADHSRSPSYNTLSSTDQAVSNSLDAPPVIETTEYVDAHDDNAVAPNAAIEGVDDNLVLVDGHRSDDQWKDINYM